MLFSSSAEKRKGEHVKLRFAITSNVLYLHVLCYDYVELVARCKGKVSIIVDVFCTNNSGLKLFCRFRRKYHLHAQH